MSIALWRRGFAAAALSFVLAACGTDLTFGNGGEREDASHVSKAGDGVLDCADGQVGRRLQLDDPVLGPSEQDVAERALAMHLGVDGELRALPPDNSWMIVKVGKDIAVVYPTETIDGWRVDSVNVCAPAPTGRDSIDGSLDCQTDETWGQDGTPSPDAVGESSAEIALGEALAPYSSRHGGDIVIENSRGSLVRDSDERVVASAVKLNNGTWVVVSIAGCADTR